MGCGLYTGLACPSSPAARGKRKFSVTGATRVCEDRAFSDSRLVEPPPRLPADPFAEFEPPPRPAERPDARSARTQGSQAAPSSCCRTAPCRPTFPRASSRTSGRPRRPSLELRAPSLIADATASRPPRAPPPALEAPSPEAPPAASAEQPGPRLRRGPAPTTARPRRATRAHHRDSTDNIRHPPSPDRCSTAHTDSRYSAR